MSEPTSIALVTGGNRGIGLAIATALKEAGHRVVITYRSGTPPTGFDAVQMDVTDSASVESAFTKIESEIGQPEIIVANAGITKDTLVLRMTDEDFESVIDANLTGAFRVAKRATKGLLKLKRGRLIFIGSVVGLIILYGLVEPYVSANPINFPLTFNLTQYRDIDFVFIGRMVEQKSPELTINSFANYLACFKPNETSCLHLIGDGELLEKMKELVIALNLEKSCFFHGELNIEETMIVLKRSKVLVSTSTIEGFGLARLEALANGCCVITTNTGGATQFLSNKSITPELVFGAFIVDSDVDEIANSMYISLQDEYWTNEAILGRRYLVNDLSAEKVAKLWIDV